MVEAIEYFFFLLLTKIARSLSFTSAGKVGALLGRSVYNFTSLRKNVTHENLAHAFPTHSQEDIQQIARGAFENYGRAVLEMLWSGGQSEEVLKRVVSIKNPELLQRLNERGGGVIFLSGHFGSWEMLLLGFRLHVGRPFYAIAQNQRNGRITKLINESRSRWGNRMIPMGVSTREVFRLLRDGEVVLLLGDQSGSRESIYVEFMGRPAATHRGPAAFALRTGAPLVMVLIHRNDDGTYDAELEEVDTRGLETSAEENVIELTRRHAKMLERHIRERPDHWLWMHKRWKHTNHYQPVDTQEQVV